MFTTYFMTGIAPKETLLYQLIVSPSYRLLRHAILVVAVGAISLSQTTYSFAGKAGLLGGRVYLMALVTFIAYLAIGYMHMYLLVPRLLLRKKYLDYLFFSSLSVALLVSIKPWQEYGIHEYFGTPHLRSNYFGAVSLLDMLSDFVLVMLCITDISMSVLLKTWLEESRRKNELEKIRLQTEVDAMKEQVNPELLFQTLHQTARLAATHPERAGATVLQLSQFLRYGLYDGSRDRVVLSAEFDF
ncbi:MAG: histidine kinase, partial [Rikenellaceae bacterium]|nr:histidine kinase [Rikenellaceae bacterium]